MRYQALNPRGLARRPQPGTTVRLTNYFLASTNQPRGCVTRWRVVSCSCELCAVGRHVAVNEPAPAGGMLASRPIATRWRHIAIGNLERVSRSAWAASQADDDDAPPTLQRIPLPATVRV